MPMQTTAWPKEKIEVAKKLIRSLGSIQDAAAKLGCTEASLRGMLKTHRIKASDLIKVKIPKVKDKDVIPAWQYYRPVLPVRKENLPKVGETDRSVRRGAVLSDIHIPYHHRRDFAVALGVLKEWRPHFLMLNGDVLDLESLSRHPKGQPDIAHLAHEYHAGNLALDEIQNAAPNAETKFLEGNHEARASRYMNEYGSLDGLLSVPQSLYVQPRSDYKREQSMLRGIGWVPLSIQPFTWNEIAWLHGVYESKYHEALHAENVGPRCSVSQLITGHMHGWQSFTSASGYTSCSSPWLGDDSLHVFRYTKGRPRPWHRGLLLIEVTHGLVNVIPVFIKNGRAVVNGKVIA